MFASDLAQRRVRARLPERQAAAQAFRGRWPLRGKPVAKLTDERTLADAGLTDDGDEGSLSATGDARVRRLEPRELVSPADEAGGALLQVQCSDAEQRPTWDPLRLALRLDRRLGPELEGLARVGDRARADQNLPRLRALFEPRRDV